MIENAYVLYGAPGSGKSEVRNILVEMLGCHVVPMSRLIEVYRPEFIPIMRKGGLIPDEPVIELLLEHTPREGNVAFDGAPRTLVQSKFMREQLLKNVRMNSINLALLEEESRRRVLEVRPSQVQRLDATPDVFEERMSNHKRHQGDVLDHLMGTSNYYLNVDANLPIPQVRAQVLQFLGQLV